MTAHPWLALATVSGCVHHGKGWTPAGRLSRGSGLHRTDLQIDCHLVDHCSLLPRVSSAGREIWQDKERLESIWNMVEALVTGEIAK